MSALRQSSDASLRRVNNLEGNIFRLQVRFMSMTGFGNINMNTIAVNISVRNRITSLVGLKPCSVNFMYDLRNIYFGP